MTSWISEMTTIIQNIVLSLCGVATVFIAYLGLSTWRKELKGKSEYVKAKEILKAVYKVKRGFTYVRNPAIWSYEYPEHMRDHWGHLKSEFIVEGTTHVYDTRWKYLGEPFLELEELTLDAQVEWGSDFQDVIVPLRKCRAELQMAIQDMIEAKKETFEPGSRSRPREREDRSVLYDGGEDSEFDKFTPKINAAIKRFENLLRPHIKK